MGLHNKLGLNQIKYKPTLNLVSMQAWKYEILVSLCMPACKPDKLMLILFRKFLYSNKTLLYGLLSFSAK